VATGEAPENMLIRTKLTLMRHRFASISSMTTIMAKKGTIKGIKAQLDQFILLKERVELVEEENWPRVVTAKAIGEILKKKLEQILTLTPRV
jgi:hypothetical protein